MRICALFRVHNHQYKRVLGHFQYYEFINKRIKCTKILFLSHCARPIKLVVSWSYYTIRELNLKKMSQTFLNDELGATQLLRDTHGGGGDSVTK